MLETHSLISLVWTLIRFLLTFLFEKQINSFSSPPEGDMNFLKLEELKRSAVLFDFYQMFSSESTRVDCKIYISSR